MNLKRKLKSILRFIECLMCQLSPSTITLNACPSDLLPEAWCAVPNYADDPPVFQPIVTTDCSGVPVTYSVWFEDSQTTYIPGYFDENGDILPVTPDSDDQAIYWIFEGVYEDPEATIKCDCIDISCPEEGFQINAIPLSPGILIYPGDYECAVLNTQDSYYVKYIIQDRCGNQVECIRTVSPELC